MDPSQNESDRNLLQRLGAKIPGFQGYMEREERRESDRLARVWMADRLQESKSGLDQLLQSLVSQARIDGLDQLERIRTKLDKLIASLRGAMRGYSGVFDYVKIQQSDLDDVYAHDMALVAEIERLATEIEEVAASDDTPGAIASRLDGRVDEVQKKFNERDAILEGITEKK